MIGCISFDGLDLDPRVSHLLPRCNTKSDQKRSEPFTTCTITSTVDTLVLYSHVIPSHFAFRISHTLIIFAHCSASQQSIVFSTRFLQLNSKSIILSNTRHKRSFEQVRRSVLQIETKVKNMMRDGEKGKLKEESQMGSKWAIFAPRGVKLSLDVSTANSVRAHGDQGKQITDCQCPNPALPCPFLLSCLLAIVVRVYVVLSLRIDCRLGQDRLRR